MAPEPERVSAAGGIVWRSEGQLLEVALVHRPRYDDWSFPKGKRQPGEGYAACALREVEEETGLRCDLGPPLTATTYRDRFDREKIVRYWAMTPISGDFLPSKEVDEIRWISLAHAERLLSYDRDRALLASSAATLRRLADDGLGGGP